VVIRRNMERLRGEVVILRDKYGDCSKDFDELMAENERLRAEVAAATGKEANPIFLKSFKIKVEQADKDADKDAPET